MVNFSDPAPEALTPVSMAGAAAPAALPELLPNVPEMSDAASKPTHLITSGCAHRVGKSWLATGGVDTVTVAESLPLPPGPVQARLNVLEFVNGPVGWLPEVGLVPDQPTEAVQEVAFVEDQVSVEDPPLATDAGLAASDTVGTRGETVTVADALAVPPNPVQERLNVLPLVNAPVDWFPEVALAPDHPAEAVQAVASVENQESVEDPPLATDMGFAASDTVGSGGGGGVPDTLTLTDAVTVPCEPAQVREKLPLAVSAPVDWLPKVALEPDHAPEAVQVVAFVEDQESIEAPPLVTDVGLAASDTAGPGGGAGSELSSAMPPPQAERPRPASRATNARSGTFDTRTPRLLGTPISPLLHKFTKHK